MSPIDQKKRRGRSESTLRSLLEFEISDRGRGGVPIGLFGGVAMLLRGGGGGGVADRVELRDEVLT